MKQHRIGVDRCGAKPICEDEKRLKKVLSAVIAGVIFVLSFCTAYGADLSLSAQSAVLMCVENGELLFESNADKRLSMASTTKIMTSLLALEAGTPEREIVVTEKMVSVEGTSMGLQAGDSVSLRELVYGMLLQSGNDAANTVAYVIGGSPEGFAAMMNARADKIGMKNTNFVTASGLDDEEHYSTARDMALLAAECLKNPEFTAICSKKTAKLTYGNPPYARTLTNHNRLLWSYPDSIGVKTGFTKKSGRCLVSAAKRGGVTLVAVTLNAPDDWSDHKQMLDYGFTVCKSGLLTCDLSQTLLPVCGGKKASAKLRLSYESEGIADAQCVLLLKPFEYVPLNEGDIVGNAVFVSGGKIVAEIPVEAAESIEAYVVPVEKQEKKGFFENLIDKIKGFFTQR